MSKGDIAAIYEDYFDDFTKRKLFGTLLLQTASIGFVY